MTKREFEKLLTELFGEKSGEAVKRLKDAGMGNFVQRVAAGVASAYTLEEIFGCGERRWEIVVEGDLVHFNRLEYYEDEGSWVRTAESFGVWIPEGLGKEKEERRNHAHHDH